MKTVDNNGTTRYFNADGQIHRDNDKPAVIWDDFTEEYYINGVRHRDNGQPTIVNRAGNGFAWYENGVFIKAERPTHHGEVETIYAKV